MTKFKIPENKIAAVSDGEHKQFIQAFRELEKFSNKYIREMVEIGGYPAAYPWPLDNLHNWSRWWEYTFVWLHIKKFLRSHDNVRLLDIGSALTFFPFFLASNGVHVTAIDVDSRMADWADRLLPQLSVLDRASKLRLTYQTSDASAMPYKNNTFDVVTNVSVIEHIPSKDTVIREVRRILKPGGIFTNTIDISLDGLPIGDSQPLGPAETQTLIHSMQEEFGKSLVFGFTHPMDMITPANYPRSITQATVVPAWREYPRQLVKLFRSRFFVTPYQATPVRMLQFLANPKRFDMWTVMGIVVQKSSISR